MRFSCSRIARIGSALLFSLATLCFPRIVLAQTRVSLSQGWTSDQRNWFYSVSQGSELMDLGWLTALEQPGSPPYAEQPLFMTNDLQRFGFIPNPDRTKNVKGLPLGFAINWRDHRALVGMTCAACHTGQVKYGSTIYQIDGAPGGADFQGFLTDLNQSLQQTAQSNQRFGRFAERVLNGSSDPVAKARLWTTFRNFAARFDPYITKSLPSDQTWGPARLDAFGMIFNRVSGYDLPDDRNYHFAKAPVSYPFLWGMPWHNKVQWNGSAPNVNKLDRLARNVGEVLGVFATADLSPPGDVLRYYKTSAYRGHMLDIEELLLKLKRPKWPAAFGPIDQDLANRGAGYYKQYCVGCHASFDPDRPKSINVFMDQLANVKTDPNMVTAAATTEVYTDQLAGVPLALYFGDKLKKRDKALSLVTNVTAGAILWPSFLDGRGLPLPDAEPLQNNDTLLRTIVSLDVPEEERTDKQSEAAGKFASAITIRSQAVEDSLSQLAYRGRPMDGIWATAPYLHNGSVPTLADLFKPSSQRTKGFYVGSNEFDPTGVGLNVNAQSSFFFDTTLDGNHNTGHEGRWWDTRANVMRIYGTDIPEDQKKAILEYMKTL